MKRVSTILVYLLIFIYFILPAYAGTILNNETLDIENISIRDFFESFNYSVQWNPNTKTVSVANDKIVINFSENVNNFFYKMKLCNEKAYISYNVLNTLYKENKENLFKDINNYYGYDLPKYYKFVDNDKRLKLIVFGASWCHNCTEQMDKLKCQLANRDELPFEFLYVSIDKSKEDVENYINKYNINILHDPEKVLLKSYNFNFIPSLIFIKDNKIIHIENKEMTFNEILQIFNDK